uniref:Macrophage mannose receptor 1-like n=1 Tax=Poecilia reticulata TaxID=8081 RepID=A0A3P9NCK8_POERE
MSDSAFYQQDKDFSNWASDQPDNYNGAENCAEMHSNGYWNDGSCSLINMFVSAANSSTQYIFIDETKNWTEAQSYCREHYSDLALIKNMEDMNTLINPVPTSTAWIGLYRAAWKWVDGSNSSFRNWNEEPRLAKEDKCEFIESKLRKSNIPGLVIQIELKTSKRVSSWV